MIDQKLKQALCCPQCHSKLSEELNQLQCAGCTQKYPVLGESIDFISLKKSYPEAKNQTDSLLFKIKNIFKRFPVFFTAIYRLTTPITGISAKSFLKYLPKDGLVINLGSGVLSVANGVIDVDYHSYANVSVVADAAHLPLKDGSVDGIIAESLLEHIADPEKVASEIKRVLKPGGLAYILTPFMLGFHSSPYDYQRWTIAGLERLFKDFKKERAGVASGPTLAFTRMAGEWLSLALSFGINSLYQFWTLVFMLLFLPVNFLDILFSRYRFASNNAMSLYFIARKK